MGMPVSCAGCCNAMAVPGLPSTDGPSPRSPCAAWDRCWWKFTVNTRTNPCCTARRSAACWTGSAATMPCWPSWNTPTANSRKFWMRWRTCRAQEATRARKRSGWRSRSPNWTTWRRRPRNGRSWWPSTNVRPMANGCWRWRRTPWNDSTAKGRKSCVYCSKPTATWTRRADLIPVWMKSPCCWIRR